MNDRVDHRAISEPPGLEGNRRIEPGSISDRVRSLRLPAQSSAGPARRTWVPWVLCLLLAGTTAAFGYQAYVRPSMDRAAPVDTPKTTDTVAPSGPVASSGEVVLENKGYIIPVHQIQVSPKVSGMVEKMFFEEGQRVQKGFILAELETVDYLADRDHALALMKVADQRWLELKNGNRPEEIEAAKAELEESEANREQLFLEWKRNSGLRVGTALAQRDYEQAAGAYKAMDRRAEKLRQAYKLMVEGARKERIAAAEADFQQAKAELAKVQWRLDNCTIRAPISGTILTKIAEEGNIVNQLSFNLKGSLCDMADLSDLEVELTVQERDVSRVFKGQVCRIRPEVFPERTYDGFVSRLMPIADRAKGAVPVRVKLTVPKDEEGVYLKPEMGAIVSFLKK